MFICVLPGFQYSSLIGMKSRVPLIARCCVLLLATALGPLRAAPQSEPGQFFAGTVIESAPEQVTVARALQGKNESRAFRITPETKIEGRLAPGARVTVGYVTDDDVDRATLIIVRPEPQGKGKSKR